MREKLFPDTQSQEFHSFLNQLFLTLIIYFELGVWAQAHAYK